MTNTALDEKLTELYNASTEEAVKIIETVLEQAKKQGVKLSYGVTSAAIEQIRRNTRQSGAEGGEALKSFEEIEYLLGTMHNGLYMQSKHGMKLSEDTVEGYVEAIQECIRVDRPSHLSKLKSALTRTGGGDADKYRAALEKIDALRNDIIGRQTIGWSAHVYPLVAILHEAGFEGLDYEKARERAMTHIDRIKELEAQLAAAPTPLAADWRDIESAPRDESLFLCRHKAKPHVTFEAAIFKEDDSWESGNKPYDVIQNMTADEPLDAEWEDLEWQPLPQPPAVGE
jgi:hypothetical protein